MSIEARMAKIQSQFFGRSRADIVNAIKRVNKVVERLGSTTPDGIAVTELQIIAEALADYAETLRIHEATITPIITEKVADAVKRGPTQFRGRRPPQNTNRQK